jgi:phosphate-selective porin OprO/OprP
MNSGLRRGCGAVAIIALTALVNVAKASPVPDDDSSPTGAALLAPGADPAADPQTPAPKDAKKGKKKDAPKPKGWHRDAFELSNGDFKVGLTGYLQENLRSYNWDVAGGDETKRSPTDELGRLRLGLESSYKNWSFQFAIDPRNSQTYKLKDLHLTYEFSKKLALQAGHFKPPFSADFLTSAAGTDFVDRSMLSDDLGADRDWGGMIHGTLSKLRYQIGVFAGDGSGKETRAGTSGAARLNYTLAKGLVIGASYMQGKVEPDVSPDPSREPAPKGFRGQSHVEWTFWRRPHVDGTRRRMGLEASFTHGPFRLIGEAAEGREQRLGQGSTKQDLPDVWGRAWYLTATYVVTGQKKVSKIRPEKGVFYGGPGAIELAARVERLHFDDTGDSSGFAGYGNRARNVAPTADWIASFGINWYVTSFLKFQANAYQDHYNDVLISPDPPETKYWSFVGRIQVGIP